MSSKTQRFGLNHYGGAVPGSLSDDGGKFTGRDRQLIDRLLAAFEVHNHQGGERLADPVSAPAVTLDPNGGALPAGTTFFYRVSYVDQYGLETAAGPEVSETTPAALEAPPTPAVTAVSGGVLEAGIYYHAATWHAADGTETTLSAPAVINLQGDLQTVRVSFADPIPAGATQVSIWRQGPLDSGFTRIATVTTTGFTYYDDTGSVASDPCACDPENMPPDTNETNATSRIRLTLPSAEISPPTLVQKWRVYRTTTSGSYPASSLMAEVTETADELTGALVDFWIDDGSAEPTAGQPLELSQTLRPSTDVGGSGGVGGQVFIADANGATWRLYASGSGQLVTEKLSTPVSATVSAFVLVDSIDKPWRVTVGTDGVLSTIQQAALTGEREWAHGTGPHLPTSDGSVTWRLGVATDGALETFGDLERANRVYLEPRAEPTTPTEGAVLWVTDAGELKFKNHLGTVATLAGP